MEVSSITQLGVELGQRFDFLFLVDRSNRLTDELILAEKLWLSLRQELTKWFTSGSESWPASGPS